ncbi:hypothetical protein GGX14DRAFT_553690 [Mycena pura]|uniref:Uncharacterized protein n=1 Tax=Mycena pura TaxID=153505 RepID=A0AAD7E6C5_9AGAR|nr:hypothetical protein GGX14DRAFT_553690 [Mycena pura]
MSPQPHHRRSPTPTTATRTQAAHRAEHAVHRAEHAARRVVHAARRARHAAEVARRADAAAVAHAMFFVQDLVVPPTSHHLLATGILDKSFRAVSQTVADIGLSAAILLTLRDRWRMIHQPPARTGTLSLAALAAAATFGEQGELLEGSSIEDAAFIMAADLYLGQKQGQRDEGLPIDIITLFSDLSALHCDSLRRCNGPADVLRWLVVAEQSRRGHARLGLRTHPAGPSCQLALAVTASLAPSHSTTLSTNTITSIKDEVDKLQSSVGAGDDMNRM